MLVAPRTQIWGSLMSMFIVLGDDVAMRAAIALLKSTQSKVTLPRAALAAPAQPVDPASLHGALRKLGSEERYPKRPR